MKQTLSYFAEPPFQHAGLLARTRLLSSEAKDFSGTLKSTKIRGVPKSEFSGSQKRGDKWGR